MAAATVVSVFLAAALSYWWFSHYVFYVPTPCGASSDARKFILSKLKPEDGRTLRSIVTLTDPDASCSSTFLFTSNGGDIEIHFLVDAIHGLKFYSDDGRTAALLSNTHVEPVTALDLSKAGAVASLDIDTIEPSTTTPPVNVLLKVERPNKSLKDANGNLLIDQYNHLMEAVTGLPMSLPGENGQRRSPIGIRFHVIWKDMRQDIVLMEHDVTAEKYYLENDNEQIIVDEMSLPKGEFTVIVKTLNDNPQFDGMFKTGLVAGMKYGGAKIPANGSVEKN